jgi:hypothetical protein
MVVSKQIEQDINALPKGSVLFVSDFTKKYEYEKARKTLQRLCNKNELIRIAHGIYYIPKQDKLLGTIHPSIEKIAGAIAKRDKARIIPTGSYAQYKLGLSTQVPMNIVYLTDGSARKIQIGKQTITFKKTSPKNLAVNHRLSNLIIQALKEYKEDSLPEEEIKRLREIIIQSNESELIKTNIRNAPVRVQKIVLQILKEIESE